MSIFVKNVNWSQTTNEIIINVPISGKKSIEDVIIAEKFLKINVRPYFYELFFEHPICVNQSTCTVLESNFKFRLRKTNDEWWSTLGKTARPVGNSSDDTISIEVKNDIFSEYEKTVKEETANKQKERANLKRNEMDKEMERASQIRKKIDETEAILKDCEMLNTKNPDVTIESAMVTKQNFEPPKHENETVSLPPIRSCATINVNLSSRQFVTPKRESQEHAEREWCAKQHDIMINRIGFCDEDLSAEERDINWLLKKGNAFLEKKNYLAAVSAFSCGMRISNDSPELLLGRAKAQYALKNYQRCAEDCSDALDRFTPAVESNLLDRIHCFWLRGKSLTALGLPDHGNRELQMAQQLDPQNFNKNQEQFMIDA